MIRTEDGFGEHRERRRRSIAEKLRIVEQTFEAGASVAQVALANGVNANQVFTWRRAFKRGELVESTGGSALLPVVMATAPEPPQQESGSSAPEPAPASGAIHIEFPGRVLITAECGADPELVRAVLESLRK